MPYSSSKRFQMTYLTALAQLSENRKFNIRIMNIRPGFVKTDFTPSVSPLHGSPHTWRKNRQLLKGKRHMTIDWRYRIIVFAWNLIPGSLWEKINLYKMIRK